MAKTYSLSSQNSGQAANVLMANVVSVSGESKLSIKPIPQLYTLYIDSISSGVETFLNLTSIEFDYIINSIYWFNSSGATQSTDILLKIYDGTTLINRLDLPAATLDDGLSLESKPFVISSNYRVSLTSEFLVDKLIFTIEPVIQLGTINVS